MFVLVFSNKLVKNILHTTKKIEGCFFSLLHKYHRYLTVYIYDNFILGINWGVYLSTRVLKLEEL